MAAAIRMAQPLLTDDEAASLDLLDALRVALTDTLADEYVVGYWTKTPVMDEFRTERRARIEQAVKVARKVIETADEGPDIASCSGVTTSADEITEKETSGSAKAARKSRKRKTPHPKTIPGHSSTRVSTRSRK